jgi:hypothetical protein
LGNDPKGSPVAIVEKTCTAAREPDDRIVHCSFGFFPPAVAPPDDVPLQDRLLGLTARDPKAAYSL